MRSNTEIKNMEDVISKENVISKYKHIDYPFDYPFDGIHFPSVSVVIPARNEEKVIKRCFNSLDYLKYPSEKLEVVVINDGSTDNTKDIIFNHQWQCKFRYIETDGVGVSEARNIGYKKASNEFIYFTDADCTLQSDVILELIKHFNEDIGGIGGPNLTPSDDSEFAQSVGILLSFLSKPGARYGFAEDKIMEINHNPTCNVLYRKAVLEEVGGFNHNLITADDEELDYRIRKKYKIMYIPSAIVNHYRKHTWNNYAKMAYSYGIGRMQAIKLHPDMGRWFHYAPMVLLLILMSLSLLSFYNIMYLFLDMILLTVGIIGMITICVYLGVKSNKKIHTLFALITIWFLCYGYGMIRGILKKI